MTSSKPCLAGMDALRKEDHADLVRGIQAVFAGFVAASRAKQIPPTIRSLWASDQLYLFKSSLCYLASSCGAITAEGLEEDTTLQRLLADVLLRSNLLRPDIQVDALDDVDRVIDVPWQLRQKAADRISSRPLAVSPMSTTSASPVSPSPSPSVSVPGWWHG